MNSAQISIRPVHRDDYVALWSVAALDSALVPSGPLLVAEADGEIVAALSLAGGESIADPFRPTAEAVALLRLRASQFPRHRPRSRSRLLGRLRGRPATLAAQ
jgi:hypothetical protein